MSNTLPTVIAVTLPLATSTYAKLLRVWNDFEVTNDLHDSDPDQFLAWLIDQAPVLPEGAHQAAS